MDEIAKLIELAKIPLSQQRILRRSSFAFQEDDGDGDDESLDGIIMVSPPESVEDDDDDDTDTTTRFQTAPENLVCNDESICVDDIIQGGGTDHAQQQNATLVRVSASAPPNKGSSSSSSLKPSHVCFTNSECSSLHLNNNPIATAKEHIEKFNYVGTSGISRTPLGKRKLPVSLVGQVDKAEAPLVKQTCMPEEEEEEEDHFPTKSPPPPPPCTNSNTNKNKPVDFLLNVLNILANNSQPRKVEPGNLMEIAMRRGLKFPTPFWPPPKGHDS